MHDSLSVVTFRHFLLCVRCQRAPWKRDRLHAGVLACMVNGWLGIFLSFFFGQSTCHFSILPTHPALLNWEPTANIDTQLIYSIILVSGTQQKGLIVVLQDGRQHTVKIIFLVMRPFIFLSSFKYAIMRYSVINYSPRYALRPHDRLIL